MSYMRVDNNHSQPRLSSARRLQQYSCRLLALLSVLSCCVLIAGSKSPTTLERIKAEGKLRIISRNGPTTYYEDGSGPTGFEYSLAREFARELGVDLVVEKEDSLATILDSVGSQRGHIGASGLTITEARRQQVNFADGYMTVTQQLVYNRKQAKPESIADLIGAKLVVVAGSSHSENLLNLQQQYPELEWQEYTDLEMIDLVEMVHNGDADYAIVDSNAYAINRSLFPQARIAFDVTGPESLAWAFSKRQDDSLYKAAQSFFQRIKTDGTLEQITQHYYGQKNQLDNSSALILAHRIEKRLPKWQAHLRDAARSFELDWRLLAAISYQESHWNPRARSYTGVRGLMMLTRDTAKEMGVTNRLDPAQSIHGGAKYFKKIISRLPSDIQGEDRVALALTAYNVGFGHMEDARVLTQRLGKNPDKWSDVKQHLPLLAKRKYYRTLKHGYARGWEPVKYVENIRKYFTLLALHEQHKQRQLALNDSSGNAYQMVSYPRPGKSFQRRSRTL